jgi:hypothetical protein
MPSRRAGQHKYEFNASGSGCRKWIADQIELFFDIGFIVDPVEVSNAQDFLLTEFRGKRPQDVGLFVL